MRAWKFFCMEDVYPGLWRRWFTSQAVAVGWCANHGFHLEGESDGGRRWSQARRCLGEMRAGDQVVVHLKHHRIGRIGEVVDKAISDSDWAPLVPPTQDMPEGEMGRRVRVRWDLSGGLVDPEVVVELPESARLSPGQLRPALCELDLPGFRRVRRASHDPANWVPLLAHRFAYERSLSEYIAAYPHRLEDGLVAYPYAKVREKVFPDGSRSDVLLMASDGTPVVVECKQGTPTTGHVRQLSNYIKQCEELTGKRARGILVHGGSRRLSRDVKRAMRSIGGRRMAAVSHKIDVDFASAE